jgi:hypothetical protein
MNWIYSDRRVDRLSKVTWPENMFVESDGEMTCFQIDPFAGLEEGGAEELAVGVADSREVFGGPDIAGCVGVGLGGVGGAGECVSEDEGAEFGGDGVERGVSLEIEGGEVDGSCSKRRIRRRPRHALEPLRICHGGV